MVMDSQPEPPSLAEIEAATDVLRRLDKLGVSPPTMARAALNAAYRARLELAALEATMGDTD